MPTTTSASNDPSPELSKAPTCPDAIVSWGSSLPLLSNPASSIEGAVVATVSGSEHAPRVSPKSAHMVATVTGDERLRVIGVPHVKTCLQGQPIGTDLSETPDRSRSMLSPGEGLEIEVKGAPKLNVSLHEVGLRSSVENIGVGGPWNAIPYHTLAADSVSDNDIWRRYRATRREIASSAVNLTTDGRRKPPRRGGSDGQ